MFINRLFFILLLFMPIHSYSEAASSPVTTVKFVDLKQYLGTWLEIASIPQYFQKKCTGNVTAEYSMASDDTISVINSCDTKNGRKTAKGRARVVDKTSNSKLEVTFVHILWWQFLLGGDYWILAIGENYSYAIVGAPNRKYAWILSRTPKMAPAMLKEAAQSLVHQGFDTCQLISTVQNGGLQERTPLCNLVKE